MGYTLWTELSQEDLDALLYVTCELRRDPKERNAELDREEGNEVLAEFLEQTETLEFQNGDSETVAVDISQFRFN
ncbi:MAG TPA: hypothetical protein V6C65_04405 [Allocoleopsis sp.]